MSIGDILPWRRDKRAHGGVGSLVFDQERRARTPPQGQSESSAAGKAKRKKPAVH